MPCASLKAKTVDCCQLRLSQLYEQPCLTSKSSNHASSGPSALALLVCLSEGAEDILNVDSRLARLVESIGKDVEHKFAIGVRVHMTVGFFIEIAT